ncbi:MAG: phospholipid carrier-dependent glycosyltransferase [Anaerolineales bacterium]|nr:phospholipid carrier-dependent glycosyltransferase [Anaerolineales bacterium]
MSTNVKSLARIRSQLSVQSLAQSPLILAAVIFLLALWPRVLNLDVFVGPDEFYWLEGSAKFTQALASGDLAQTYHAGHPGVALMWAETIGSWVKFGLNGFSNWPVAVGADNSIEALAYKRQVVGIANTLLLTLQVIFIRHIFGSGVAWLAGFLLAFDPFLLTESRAVRTEGMLTSLSTLALLALLLYSTQPRLRYVILAGGLTGMALLSKVSAVALLPIELLVIISAPFWRGQNHGELKEAGSTWPKQQQIFAINIRLLINGLSLLLLWMGVLLLVVFLLWPALWVEPIKTIQQMYDYVAFRAVEGEGGGSVHFSGALSSTIKISAHLSIQWFCFIAPARLCG